MGQVININKMASSIYQTMLKLQQSATEMVGLDAQWCRAIPYKNSEDIIVQEYTLSNVECPRNIRIVTDKNDYQPGNYNVDLWGVNYENPLDISIDIKTWEAIYGKNTMPQKGDIVFIQMLHRPYEVASATVVYGVGELPTSFKCSLRKYQRTASRRENEEFQIQVDTLANNQIEMFGDDISKEVADSVMTAEKTGNISTYVDPIKSCDLNSIITQHIIGAKGNIISEAHYSFKNANKPIIYSITDSIDISNTHLISSMWFKINEQLNKQYKLEINGIYTKDKDYWYFTVNNEKELNSSIPDNTYVYIKRGNTLLIPGIVSMQNDIDDKGNCKNIFTLQVKTSDVLQATQKIPNWWYSKGIWRLSTDNQYTLLNMYNDVNNVYSCSINSGCINLVYNNSTINIPFSKQFNFNDWSYIAIDIYQNQVYTVISQLQTSINGNIKDVILYKDKNNIDISNTILNFDKITIPLNTIDIDVSNFRIYNSEYSIENEYQMDMYSQLVQNASKLIIVDTPLNKNDMSFISPVR